MCSYLKLHPMTEVAREDLLTSTVLHSTLERDPRLSHWSQLEMG